MLAKVFVSTNYKNFDSFFYNSNSNSINNTKMATEIQETKLSWLLQVADRIQSFFSTKSHIDSIIDIIKKVRDEHGAIIAYDEIASTGVTFMIIATDPRQLFLDIIDEIKNANSKTFQELFNPITIIMRLIDEEYRMDMGNTRLCYGVKTTIPSNYLMKSFACRIVSQIKSYKDFIDNESFMFIPDKIKELHPQYEYNTKMNKIIGAKKSKSKPGEKKKINIRRTIIAKLIEYIRKNSQIASGIIFINELSECTSSAINIMYTEHKYKEAIVDYLKILINNEQYKNYTFKTFLHADFKIPYDYRLIKHSCLINDIETNQPTYIANLYNTATYELVPCINLEINNSFIQIAHPVVKLRFLYLDMFMIEHKTGSANPKNHEKIYQSKMMEAFNEVQAFDKIPIWIGIFIDEVFEKNKYNIQMKMTNPIETFLI